jgi:hypothetical protein
VHSFEEWLEYAKSLDYLEGREEWKRNNQSRLYDYAKIEARYKLMKKLRKSNDLCSLVHSLRQDL